MKLGKGRIPIAIGALLVICAIALTLYNVFENNKVQAESEGIVSQLAEQISAGTVQTQIPAGTKAEEATELPYYLLDPDLEMPTQKIDGNDYIGVVSISALGVTLPVISEYSESALKTAPCRYFGTAYQNNLVIAAHNYRAHFGRLSKLSPGDEVVFTDIDGNVFVYEVVETEILPPNAVEEVTCGEWDLTLFTCTYGGAQRITVRCDLKDLT